jgi:hypothetical protein
MTASGTPPVSSDLPAMLNRLDRQLGEIGRRQHRFAWLRDTRTGDWLVLDAYYPGNRVVVLASDDAGLLRVCEDLVPRNGLFLLTVSAGDLGSDTAEGVKRLRARLEIQGWRNRTEEPGGGPSVPVPPRGPAPLPSSGPAPLPSRGPAPLPSRGPAPLPSRGPAPLPSRGPAPLPLRGPAPLPSRGPGSGPRGAAAERSSAPVTDSEEFDVPADVRLRPPPSPARPRASATEGMGVGITLVIAVALELLVGGGVIGLGAGDYVLGFGCLLDACARVLGTIAASQAGDIDAAWTRVLFGSPALWGLRESEPSDLAPVARVTAILAGVAVALGLLLVVV